MISHISYAVNFACFLLNELDDISNIKNIILFGSAARGEARKDSDLDIFLDMYKIDKNKEKKIRDLVEKFYRTKDFLIYKNEGIYNVINLSIGKLEEWTELKESIESDGIVLFGKYKTGDFSKTKGVLVYWDKIGKNRGAFLNSVYGFNSGGKKYLGIIGKYGGEKVGKSSVIIPAEIKKNMSELIKKYNVSAKFKEIYF